MATAAKIEVPPLIPFDPISEPTSVSQRWKAWKRRFEIYLIAVNVKDDAQKRALLLYQAGEATQEIFDTLEETGDDYKTAIEKLDEYFTPKKNVDYEIFQFRQAKQNNGETTDQFATRLRKLAAHCEFHDLDQEIKTAIIQNGRSKHLRRFALRQDKVTLKDLLSKARALENSEREAKGIEEKLASASLRDEVDEANYISRPSLRQSGQQCRNCGLAWPHRNSPCPAQGQTCRKCNKLNHYARVCRSARVQVPNNRARVNVRQHNNKNNQENVQNIESQEPQASSPSSGSDDEFLFTCVDSKLPKMPSVNVKVSNVKVKMIIDTGASINIIDEKTFAHISKSTPISLKRTRTKLFAYGSTEQLPVIGQFEAILETKKRITVSTLHVVKGNCGSLLSYQTATELNLIQVSINNVKVESTDKCKHESSKISKTKIEKQFPKLFQGIGQLKNFEVKLHIDPTVSPVAQPARRIPFHMRRKVSDALKQLEDDDIIETVEGPTPWISPLVIIPKNDGTVRLCVDMRMANRAIQRERHPSPTVDDLINELNGAQVFSKLDLRSGYHQLSLAPESRYITTFATHKGLRRYKRLNFGTNSASELFQQVIHDQIHDIPGAINISDDVIIYGKSQEQHDAALHAVCQRFADIGLTLNRAKCQFSQTKLTFFGMVFSAEGISADPLKVSAIKNASSPNSVKDVRSFLGMAAYCSKFIPNFSTLSEPLRKLTVKNAKFCWTKREQNAFDNIKSALTSNTVMAYFDQTKQTELITDASPWGLSAILAQKTTTHDDRRIVAYASRSLSEIERKYSQTEREALAIVWAMERLQIYLRGGKFTLYTDCKPIELILRNPKSKPPARIERWNLRIQDFDFDVVYTDGNTNPSDFLSRHPCPETDNKHETSAENYVNFITTHAVPKAMTVKEIQDATKNDETLQHLAEIIRKQTWNSINDIQTSAENLNELKLFAKVRDELTVNEQLGIILRGTRIIMPYSLRQRAIKLAHEGHQGLAKTKQLIREKLWFPRIDKNVEELIRSCIPCQANCTAAHPVPLKMNELPPKPWHTVHVDFCGPFPTGEYLLVVIDAYSRFPEVEIVKSTSAVSTIAKFERIFATHGLPHIIKSDNGPPFNSNDIRLYMKENGIKHQRITPLWPQANSEVENFMKPMEKAIRAACIEKKNWRKELFSFLLNYRATPHTTTKFSPAELLFNRTIDIKLPSNIMQNDTKIDQQVRENDRNGKEKMKMNADKFNHAKEHTILVGDTVLVRQQKKNKLSTRFDPEPYQVTRVKGTMVTATRPGHYVTRNISFFKKISPQQSHRQDTDREEEEILDELNDSDNEINVERNNADGLNNGELVDRRYPLRDRRPIYRYGQNIYS